MHQLGFSVEEYDKFVQSYVDRLDAQLQKNEFLEASYILKEFANELLARQLIGMKRILVGVEVAEAHVAEVKSLLFDLLRRKESSNAELLR